MLLNTNLASSSIKRFTSALWYHSAIEFKRTVDTVTQKIKEKKDDFKLHFWE